MALTDAQQKALLALVERVTWEEVETGLNDIDRALRFAMETSWNEFLHWETQAHQAGFQSEFDPELTSRNWSQHWRFAHVARLIRTISLWYGIETDDSRLPGQLVPALRAQDPFAEPVREHDNVSLPLREMLSILQPSRNASERSDFDPDAWEGELEELRGRDVLFSDDPELAERTFASKSEAFTAGWYLGRTSEEGAQ